MKYFLIMLLVIIGCAPMQNLSVADVRNDSHLRHSGVIQMPIEKALNVPKKQTIIAVLEVAQ